jgi:predicted DCC family thiol-disulfide oxidoreductase YuxK
MAVLYDGACRFCRWCVAMILRWDREHRLNPVEIQSPYGQLLLSAVPPVERLRSAHVALADGEILSGAIAAPALLRVLPLGGGFAAIVSAVMPLNAALYRVVAKSRGRVGRMLPESWCDSADGVIADRRRGITPPTTAR